MWIKLNDVMLDSDGVNDIRLEGSSVKVEKKDCRQITVGFESVEDAKEAFDKAYEKLDALDIEKMVEINRKSAKNDRISERISDTRTVNVLRKMGCKTLGDLEMLSETDLLNTKGVGAHVIDTIRQTLDKAGMKLN